MADFEDARDEVGGTGGAAGRSDVPIVNGGLLDPRTFPSNLPPLAPPLANGLRHIDAYPGMNYVSPIHPHSLTLEGLRNFIARIVIPDYGPHITFINDEPRNPSPDQPVTDATARMVERAVVDSGFNSVNVNSTTGGMHGKDSNHPLPKARAVDIDMIDGRTISPGNPDARILQDVFARQPDIHENFGPGYQITVPWRGALPKPVPKVKEDHKGHDHFSALPRGNR